MGRDERWFRRNFRADEGGEGGGTATEEGVDTSRSGFDWGEQADSEYAKRFPGGPEEMFRTINESRKVIGAHGTEKQQLEAELERLRTEREAEEEVWEDPLTSGALPSGVDPAVEARLVALFQHSPGDAYDLAQQAAPGYGPDLQNRMFVAWMNRDPVACFRHVMLGEVTPLMDERFQSFEDVLDERLGPALSHAVQQISGAGVLLSRSIAPDIKTYEPRIEEMIVGNPALVADVTDDSQKMAERLVQLRDLLAAGDARIAAGKEPEVEPDEATKKDLPAPRANARNAVLGASDAKGPDLGTADYAERMTLKQPGRRRASSV